MNILAHCTIMAMKMFLVSVLMVQFTLHSSAPERAVLEERVVVEFSAL